MEKTKQLTRLFKGLVVVTILASFLPWQAANVSPVKEVKAEINNLIVDPSFDQELHDNWFLWTGQDAQREFNLMRGYSTPFGYGPYSMAIAAGEGGGSIFDAGLSSINDNRFNLVGEQNYIFSFFARANEPLTFSLKLERTDNFQAIVPAQEVEVTSSWKKYQITFTPTESATASLSFLFGDIPDNATLYFDGFSLFENTVTLTTSRISGYIGDANKSLVLNNGNLFTLEDIEIELPYFDHQTGEATVKKFYPTNRSGSTFYFTMPEQTYSGLGRVYAAGTYVGLFDYNVMLKLNSFAPNPVRVDEDLVIYGTGFSPVLENNFLVISAIDNNGQEVEKWVSPHIVDSKLSQMVVKLPLGVVNGRFSARSYYNDASGTGIELKSNTLSFTVKPVVYGLDWSRPGYEQIGDKITIFGKGLSTRSTVYFYDETGQKISTARGNFVGIDEEQGYEKLEVITPRALNKLQVTVKVGTHESDITDAFSYTARPVLRSIQTRNYRAMPITNARIYAAQPGEKIRLLGQGFKNAEYLAIEFPTLEGTTTAWVSAENIDPRGTWFEVVVPENAQSGHITLEFNGQQSNSLPLEIIPVIISMTPLVPTPGAELSFWTNGVGLNPDLVTVYFQLTTRETVEVKPIRLETSEWGNVIVTVVTPNAISQDSSTIGIKYGEWTDKQTYSLQTNPNITRASLDMDTKILTIQGSGFSNTLADNQITYKFADGTVVQPKVRMIKMENSTEGQEIKIQILDDYYYGYVSVTVGGQTSNEYNIGPISITRIDRRVQFVSSEGRTMGVLYISGKNFGSEGDVKVGDIWADTHYRSSFFIIAVVEAEDVYRNPVIVTKQQ